MVIDYWLLGFVWLLYLGLLVIFKKMPIFTYQCKKCLEKFDILVGMSRDKPELKCPKCQSNDLEKQFAPFRVSGSLREGSSSKCSSCSGGNCSGCH